MKNNTGIQTFDIAKYCKHKEIKRYKSGWHCSNCATRFYVAKAKPRSVVAAVAGAYCDCYRSLFIKRQSAQQKPQRCKIRRMAIKSMISSDTCVLCGSHCGHYFETEKKLLYKEKWENEVGYFTKTGDVILESECGVAWICSHCFKKLKKVFRFKMKKIDYKKEEV